MQVIFKYEIRPGLAQTISLPKGAEVLHVDWQKGKLCLWALVNNDVPAVVRQLSVVGTGWAEVSLPAADWYVGTVLTPDHFVWHVFVGPE